jgi:hypothetical protein
VSVALLAFVQEFEAFQSLLRRKKYEIDARDAPCHRLAHVAVEVRYRDETAVLREMSLVAESARAFQRPRRALPAWSDPEPRRVGSAGWRRACAGRLARRKTRALQHRSDERNMRKIEGIERCRRYDDFVLRDRSVHRKRRVCNVPVWDSSSACSLCLATVSALPGVLAAICKHSCWLKGRPSGEDQFSRKSPSIS